MYSTPTAIGNYVCAASWVQGSSVRVIAGIGNRDADRQQQVDVFSVDCPDGRPQKVYSINATDPVTRGKAFSEAGQGQVSPHRTLEPNGSESVRTVKSILSYDKIRSASMSEISRWAPSYLGDQVSSSLRSVRFNPSHREHFKNNSMPCTTAYCKLDRKSEERDGLHVC